MTTADLSFNDIETRHPVLLPNPEIDREDALEHASNLLGCANQLMLDAALGDGGKHSVWAAHYLGDLAKAIIDSALSNAAREYQGHIAE